MKVCLSSNLNMSLDLNERHILFSYQDMNQMRNYLFVIDKYYIYSNKISGKELNFNNFLSLLERKFKSEKYIAYVNGTIAKFFSKWFTFYQYFNRFRNDI